MVDAPFCVTLVGADGPRRDLSMDYPGPRRRFSIESQPRWPYPHATCPRSRGRSTATLKGPRMAVKKAMSAKNGGPALKTAPSSKGTAKATPARTTGARVVRAVRATAARATVAARKVAPARATSTKRTATKTTAAKPTTTKATARKSAATKATAKKGTAKSASAPSSRVTARKTTKAAATKPWTTKELAVVRAALEADLARLRAEIAAAEYDLAGLMRDAGDGAGDDQADAGTKTC